MNSYNEVRQALDPVVGVPFKDLAPVIGVDFPSDPRKRKAAGAKVVESLLRIAQNSIPMPDLEALGTEVKTIPLNTLSTPREWTKVTSFSLVKTKEQSEFRRSSVFKKLRSILFVPIMKANNDSPDYWYLRPPFLWLPSEEQLEKFDADYEKIRAAAVAEDWSGLTGSPGTYLTLNTSDTTTAGKSEAEKRRAWWLTKSVTDEICKQNLWPVAAVEMQRDLLEAKQR